MRRFLTIALLLTACRASGPSPAPDVTPTQTVAAPTQWLVWTRGPEEFETRYLEADGVGGVRELGVAPGAWIGAGDAVWEFARMNVTAGQLDCDCVYVAEQEGSAPDCTRAAQFEIGALRKLAAPGVIELPAVAAIEPQTQAIYTRLDGTAGPFAFVTTCTERYFCGAAHPDSVCAQRIVDLRTGADVAPAAMCAAPLTGGAAREILRDAYEDESELEALADDAIALTRVAPVYDGTTSPRMEEQYTGPTCYACSDGLWDAYTVSSTRTVDGVGAPITEWLSTAPAPPSAVMSPEARVGGWSVVPADPALRQGLHAAFAPR